MNWCSMWAQAETDDLTSQKEEEDMLINWLATIWVFTRNARSHINCRTVIKYREFLFAVFSWINPLHREKLLVILYETF